MRTLSVMYSLSFMGRTDELLSTADRRQASDARTSKYFKGVYGCHLAGDTPDGVLKYIKRSITFTEKPAIYSKSRKVSTRGQPRKTLSW